MGPSSSTLILMQERATINDATRLSDGSYVSLKMINPSKHPFQVEIASYCSSEDLASDIQNHCVPLYEVLTVPNITDTVILVMPLLRRWDEPHFATVADGMDFAKQLLQVGVVIIHSGD